MLIASSPAHLCLQLFDKIAEYAVRVQHMTYYCLLSVGRFNLCILSYQHLAIYAHKDKMLVDHIVLPLRVHPTDLSPSRF